MRLLIGKGTKDHREPDGDRTVFWAAFALLQVLCVGILLMQFIRLILFAIRVREAQP